MSCHINIRSFSKAGNDEVDDGNKIGNKEIKENLSKADSLKTRFFTLEARKTFTCLKKVFIKVPILHHLDLEHYIGIETDISSFVIHRIFSKLTLGHMIPINPNLCTPKFANAIR